MEDKWNDAGDNEMGDNNDVHPQCQGNNGEGQGDDEQGMTSTKTRTRTRTRRMTTTTTSTKTRTGRFLICYRHYLTLSHGSSSQIVKGNGEGERNLVQISVINHSG